MIKNVFAFWLNHYHFIIFIIFIIIFILLLCCNFCLRGREKQTAPKIPKENVVQLGTHPVPKSADDDWWHQAHGTNSETIINF